IGGQHEDVRRSGGPSFLAGAPYQAVTFHGNKLRADRVRSEAQLRRHLFGCQAAALKQRSNPSAACVEKLLPQHVVTPFGRASLGGGETAPKACLSRTPLPWSRSASPS